MKSTWKYLTGISGPSGYGSKTTAEQVAEDCFASMPTSHAHNLTAIVTGATSGIGAETARVLSGKGIRVIIPARDLIKAGKIKENIQKESPKAEIVIMEMDLSSVHSIHRFCSQFLSLDLPLHILINNAGNYSQKLEFSEDKIELTFATNYLGHFVLTELVLGKMMETASETGIEGRIVNVSSTIHNWVDNTSHFCFTQMLSPNSYNGTRAYAQSKVANIMHALELSTQLRARKANVTINAVHPGIVNTSIAKDYKGFISDTFYFLASKFLKSTSQGAATTCYVALSSKMGGVSGKYFADCNETQCSRLANDAVEAASLWNQTRAFLKMRFHLPDMGVS